MSEDKMDETVVGDDGFTDLQRKNWEEIEERNRKAIEDVDAAGVPDLTDDLEDILRKVGNTASAIRLISSSQGLEDDLSNALFGLAETLDALNEDATTVSNQISQKTWAIQRGYFVVIPKERRDECLPFSKGELDRLQAFISEQRPNQVA